MLLTATAPPSAKKMMTTLAGPSAEVVAASVNKPNLQYHVTECYWKTSGMCMWNDVCECIALHTRDMTTSQLVRLHGMNLLFCRGAYTCIPAGYMSVMG